MKYKNRLIVPTLVSTGLLASTIVVNAEEVEQDEQYSQQNIAEYSNADQTSETDLDFIDSDEQEDTDEESPEDSDEEDEDSDEESEDDSEEEASDEVEDVDITDEEENDAETAEENEELSEIEEEASEEVDETEIVEEDVEAPVEEETDTEVTAEETQDEESDTEEETSEVVVEETDAIEEDTEADVVQEDSVEDTDSEDDSEEELTSEELEENTDSEENTVDGEEEQEAPSEETAPEENSEADAAEESEESVEDADSEELEEDSDAEENTVDTEEEQGTPAEETSSEDDSEEEITDESDEQEAVVSEEAEETNEVEEEAAASEEETETAELETEDIDTQTEETEPEEDTYNYDSESLEQELENLSEEERTAFLEENADDIEADEEMLNELTEAISEEHGIDLAANEVYSADVSTMSMSQAITDINEYIAANDFDVAEIQYDLIEGLPQYAFESNYGWEPENGKVGQPSGVVLHDVGNENSTIHGEISYMSENWDNAFVHAFVDADNIIQVANTDYLAYGAGEFSNQKHLHVELVRHDNQHDFAKSINNYADYIANLLYKYKLPAERVDASTEEGTLWSHVEVSHIMGGTASPDPYEYFASHGYAYEDVISLIGSRYDNLYNKVTAPSIYMPTYEGDTENLAGEITNQNRGLYESITDVRTYDASNYLGQDLHVVRSEIYNYEEYYLLADADGTEIGWMYAGDVVTSALDVEPEEETDAPEEEEHETPEPDTPDEDSDNNNEGSDDTGNDDYDQTPEEDEDISQNDGTEDQPDSGSEETAEENTDSGQESDDDPAETAPEQEDSDETPEENSDDENADSDQEADEEDTSSEDTTDEEDTDETQTSDVDYETENSVQIGAGDTFVGESIAPGTYLITNQDHDIGGNISVWYTDEYGIEHARIIEIIGGERNATNGVRVTLQENDRISIENTEDMLFTPSSDIVDDENDLGISAVDDGYHVIPGEFIVGQGIAPGAYTVSNTDEIGSNFVVWGPADEYGFEELKYNEIIGTGDHAILSLEVELAEGDRIEVSGANNLLFSSTGTVPETDEGSDDQDTENGSEDTSNEGTGNNGADNTPGDDADTETDGGTTESSDDGSTDAGEDDSSGGATADSEDGDVYSSLEDVETGVRVVSKSDELDGKSLVVTVLGSSDAIGAEHDLYDIHVLDENGALYDLQNPVTVYLPAGGYVSNVYYLGNIGETLEAVNFRTEDGYAVFETDSFSQYAVVYGTEDADNTTVAPVSENKDHSAGEKSTDRANEHPAVYTEEADDTEAAAAVSDSGDGSADGAAAESEVLPNTGVAEQSTTIFAGILAALGLGFLVKRRKPTNK